MKISKMPLDECSAAMGFQVGFKGVGFFSVFKCYCVFDFPRFVFGCVRNITFIVFFKAGFQVFGTADVEMGSGCFINENVNAMEVGHQRKFFRITFMVVRCRIARLRELTLLYAAASFARSVSLRLFFASKKNLRISNLTACHFKS